MNASLRLIGWTLLAALLLTLLIGAATYQRAGWPGPVAGEATHLMQAESLLADGDLVYERGDHDRWTAARGEPTDVELASSSEGRRISFDQPFAYAVWLTPFVAWRADGFALANALLLALAALIAARTLERRIGAPAALWTVLLVFGSVLFGYAFLATDDLFLMVLTVLAFCLVASTRPPMGRAADGVAGSGEARDLSDDRRAIGRRWWMTGLLLSPVVLAEPLTAPLALGAGLAAPPRHKGSARGALVVALGVGLLVQLVVAWWAGGGPFGSRFRFTPETGFPLVDFAAAEWNENVHRFQALYPEGSLRFAWGVDARLWLWDALYLFVGRSIGLLPYFAPILLLLPGCRRRGLPRAVLVASLIWAVLVVVLRPFDIYGGEGAIGNRLFLPIYGALWLAAVPPRRPSTAAIGAALVTGVAAFFMVPLWSNPWAPPVDPGRGYRHVGELARRHLPYETSQQRMPGGQATDHDGLMIKFLSQNGWAEARRGRLMLDGGGPAELLVGSTLRLDVLRFELGREAPANLEVRGGKLGERLLRPDGGVAFRVLPRGPARHHPMWWTPQPLWLYPLEITLPGAPGRPLAFRVVGETVGGEG